MKVKIVLIDGAVIEADGTAHEIVELTDALRRSHQIAGPGNGTADALGGTPPESGAVPVDASDVVGPVEADVRESLGARNEHDPIASDFEVEQGLETEGTEDQPEGDEVPIKESSRSPGPPLDLVVREVADQFRLLGDPTRLQILTLLRGVGHNVGELCEALGGQSQPNVSHHLALLRLSGLVTPSRDGQFNVYDLTDQGRTLTQAVGRFSASDGTRASALFRHASDPTRLQILIILSERDRNVGELCSDLGGQSQPAVSHHLALLRHGGLIEARRAGKFSYYSLREEGRGLTGLVAPMMAAKALADSGPTDDTSEAEAFDFSGIPDDWMDDTSFAEGDAGGDDEISPGGAPPSHMLCRRILLMVRELHRQGFERLRVVPGLSPSGLQWRCSIVPAGFVRRDHGVMADDEGGFAASYESGQGARFFDWMDAEHDRPVALAGKFLERFSDVAALGKGHDPEYARWYARMLRATNPDGLIYAYAAWELPGDHLPALGCTADVKIPLPPPTRLSSED